MENFQVHPQSLKHLLGSIQARTLALPDFQRDFVWEPRATEELIESIARSFPAGSLLLMPYRPDTFTPRAIQNAPVLDDFLPSKLVLDGQQRLTSLYQAFYGVSDYRYFFDLKPLLDDEDIEEAVFYRHVNRSGRLRTLEQQADALVLPLGVLFSETGGFYAWWESVVEHKRNEGEDVVELKDRVRGVYDRFIKPMEEYQFPVVTLDQETSLEAVCSIFETLNRTGIRLSVFELLAARFYAKGLDLRGLWQTTLEKHPIIEQFAVEQYYVLQSIALRTRSSVKRGDVLKLTVDDIKRHWDVVADGYRQALEMLRSECGVLTHKWLPYGYLLVPMSAIWEEATEGGPSGGANRERIKRWFWCSGFSQTYDRAANTQAAKDFNQLRRWFAGEAAPDVVTDFEFDSAALRAITPRQQSVYKALIALVLRGGAMDFHHAHRLTSEIVVAKGVDDHHIFPKAFLNPTPESDGYPSELVDCVLNRTLIDADTNRSIGKRAPSDYLAPVRAELDQVSGDSFDRVLASHLMPAGQDSPLIHDDFVGFLIWREARFAEEVARVTGWDIKAAKV
jgi:hypothetical protein